MDRKQSRRSFMYVGAVLGSLLEEFLLGDEDDENVETETHDNQDTEHKSQSDLGQHATGDEYKSVTDFKALGTLVSYLNGQIAATGDAGVAIMRILSDRPTDRSTESPLGVEGETGSEATND